jgi:hypothetical protein
MFERIFRVTAMLFSIFFGFAGGVAFCNRTHSDNMFTGVDSLTMIATFIAALYVGLIAVFGAPTAPPSRRPELNAQAEQRAEEGVG